MAPRTVRLILVWNAALTVLLLVSLAVNGSLVQAAADPPVKVFTANMDTIGADSNSKLDGVSLNSASYVNLLSTKVVLTSASTCIAVASTYANAAGNASTHHIGFGLDTTSSITPGSDRQIYFPNTVGAQEVTTVYGYNNLNGTHTIYLLGTGTPAMTIGIRSMAVMCFTSKL